MTGQLTGNQDPGDKGKGEIEIAPSDSQLGEIVDVLKSIDEKLQYIVNAVRDINARG